MTLETIELLTVGEDGRAVEGPCVTYERDEWLRVGPEPDPDPDKGVMMVAYRMKFFRVGEDGREVPGTRVAFLVPESLCEDGEYGHVPSRRAHELVTQRMGWL